MPKGGKRPGAGRPRGTGHPLKSTLDKEAAREVLREIVKANLQPMVEAQIANAKGLKYLVARDKKTGKFVRLTAEMADALDKASDEEREIIEVWEKDPSVQAFTDLLNRTIDLPAKPPEKHDVTVTVDLAGRLAEGRKRVAARGHGSGSK